jgi:hypothetical protein
MKAAIGGHTHGRVVERGYEMVAQLYYRSDPIS